MSRNHQLLTHQSLPATETEPSAGPETEAPRSEATRLLHGATRFCSFAVLALVISTAAIWLFSREASPNASADAFLWLTGQNKTWDEYQAEQKAAGRPRLDEKEYDWMQQLVNDAYSN